MTGWDLFLLIPAAYIAYITLVSLMRIRRDEVVRELETEVAVQQRKRELEENRERQRRRHEAQADRLRALREQQVQPGQTQSDEERLLQELDARSETPV